MFAGDRCMFLESGRFQKGDRVEAFKREKMKGLGEPYTEEREIQGFGVLGCKRRNGNFCFLQNVPRSHPNADTNGTSM